MFVVVFALHHRYIQTLKDNEALRKSLGAAGQKVVSTRTIEYVVKDLFQWYARGAETRRRRSFLSLLACAFALAASVPFAIVLFFFYNFTVRIWFYFTTFYSF
jgi:hypothetical protein